MGKFDGVLLVSDFDDTLYGLDLRVCPRNIEALNYFIAQGGRFTVATGRAHTTFAPYVHLAPINAPVILSNGSAIYDFQQDRSLVQTYLDPRAPQDMTALAADIPEIGFEAYHNEDIYVYNYCAGDNQNDISMLAVSAIPFAPANCAPEVKEWGARVLCHCNDGLMAEIVALLDRRYPEQ